MRTIVLGCIVSGRCQYCYEYVYCTALSGVTFKGIAVDQFQSKRVHNFILSPLDGVSSPKVLVNNLLSNLAILNATHDATATVSRHTT